MDKNSIIMPSEYDNLLLSFISKLDSFNYAQGSEGRVYFVDDKFIVKKFFMDRESLEMLELFCREIKGFADAGYNVPNIYSWTGIPRQNGRFDCYILEERVQGEKLFDISFDSIYSFCKDLCSTQEFHDALFTMNNPELYGVIVREYIKKFISINNNLLNVSESEVEAFLTSEYEMGLRCRYSALDVQPENVMFDGSKLTIIDNAFLEEEKFLDFEEVVKINLMRDMFLIFLYNQEIRGLSTRNCSISPEILKLKQENMEACFLAMRRFVRKANQIYSPKIDNEYDYMACESVANYVLDKKLAEEICTEVQRIF